jgi:hypothetical protein
MGGGVRREGMGWGGDEMGRRDGKEGNRAEVSHLNLSLQILARLFNYIPSSISQVPCLQVIH